MTHASAVTKPRIAKPLTTQPAVLSRIVVPTDFSPPSGNALKYALAVSQVYGSQVKTVHAIDPLDYRFGTEQSRELQRVQIWTTARENMNTWLKDTNAVKCKPVLMEGDPSAVVQELWANGQADALVLGTAGRQHSARALFGSVAEEVFRSARCPVFVVGPNVLVGDGPVKLKKLLFATDLEPHSLAALPELERLSSGLDADVFVIRVIHPDIRSAVEKYRIREKTEQRLRASAGLELSDRIQDIRVAFDNVVHAICARAEEVDADAIVMGVRSGSPWDRAATHIPWAIAHRVIAEANCPVLTLRVPAQTVR